MLIAPELETNIINSYLRMASQTDSLWMPTFPEITGDTRRMNSNHGVATIADACAKGLTDFDVNLAFEACRKGIEEKTLAPWSGAPAGKLDDFYKEHGYIPALAMGETETIPEVNSFEKRQPGIYLEPTGCDTSHGSIVEYNGQWYAFYHNQDLSGQGNLRSICVDKLEYNPDGTIQAVKQTKAEASEKNS